MVKYWLRMVEFWLADGFGQEMLREEFKPALGQIKPSDWFRGQQRSLSEDFIFWLTHLLTVIHVIINA
jgi:hypothetical protein